MMRTILALLACSVLSYAQHSPATVTGSYHFTTPQTEQSVEQAATLIKVVCDVSDASADAPTATLNFSGPAESINFAAWLLPQIDKTTGDNGLHEYSLPAGDIARIDFVSNAQTNQDMQELLTVLRTVADVRKVYAITANRAMVLCGPEWQVAFAHWIIDQLNQPAGQKPDPTPRAFTVGGPDYKGTGHGARVNFLASATSPRQTQEVLTVLRTVGQIQKVFSYTASHALVLRAGDTDLERTEWLIQQLDRSAGPPSAATYTAPAGDDVTRIFYLGSATPQWMNGAVSGLRSQLNLRKMFWTTSPANIIVRGTTDEIAAAMKWMAMHNALSE